MLKRIQALIGTNDMTPQDTTTTTQTQAKQSAARTALHKDHAEMGNDVTTRKGRGGLNEGGKVQGHEDITRRKKPQVIKRKIKPSR